jgi:hypothetical protein
MSPEEVLGELDRLARRLGIEVRFDVFDREGGGRGGLCKVRGKRRIVVNSALPILDQVGVLEEALGKLDLEDVFAPPAVRAGIERRRGEVPSAGPALRKAAPREK